MGEKTVTGAQEERAELGSSLQLDQSAGLLPPADSRIQDHKLNLYAQQLNQRQSLFSVLLAAAALMVLTFMVLVAVLASKGAFDTHSVIVLGLTAAMPMGLILGLMRMVYRRDDDSPSKDDEPKVTDVSAFISAVNELISATKGLFKKD